MPTYDNFEGIPLNIVWGANIMTPDYIAGLVGKVIFIHFLWFVQKEFKR